MSRPSTATPSTATHHDNSVRSPAGGEPRDLTIFVSRLDGATITIAAAARAPDLHEEERVLSLQIAPAGSGLATSIDLDADEVRRIVDHLLVVGPAGPSPDGGTEPRGGGPAAGGSEAPAGSAPKSPLGVANEPGARITIVTGEGTTAEGLRHALAAVPAGARLLDFFTDSEVVLVFDDASA